MEYDEVFANVKARILEGMVFHDEMTRYFDFLTLYGYRDKQRKQYEEETEGYIKLCDYYQHHYNKLIPHTPMERPDVIPESWYMYTRQDVDPNTKKQSVKSALKKWEEWESETRDIYEDMCGELLNNGEIASARFLMEYVDDVDAELCRVTNHRIHLESIGYDLSFILSEQ